MFTHLAHIATIIGKRHCCTCIQVQRHRVPFTRTHTQTHTHRALGLSSSAAHCTPISTMIALRVLRARLHQINNFVYYKYMRMHALVGKRTGGARAIVHHRSLSCVRIKDASVLLLQCCVFVWLSNTARRLTATAVTEWCSESRVDGELVRAPD